MFWLDKFIKDLISSAKYKPYHIDDMKTPSGRIHVGSLRGMVIHDLLYKGLLEAKQKAVYTFCINDMDAMDSYPSYLPKKFKNYLGWPLFKVPSPDKKAVSFARFFAHEFIQVSRIIGCRPKIIWTSSLYQKGKFDKIIKKLLDETLLIRKIFKEQYPNFKEKNYFPYMPICSSCGKISTTKISHWDGKYVYYSCQKKGVAYTKGCGYQGKTKPQGLNGKMPWKIEWPAHWKVLGVTIEWAGKDLMTKGGAHEVSAKISEKVLNYPPPQAVLYEHFLISGKRMSTSKGVGISAAQISQILPPEILRFLLVKTFYKKTINFEPYGETIPNLFDEYDKYAQDFYSKKPTDFGRIWQLSQTKNPPKKLPFLPRFREVANCLHNPSIDIKKKFKKIKGSDLTNTELEILKERIKYAKIWLENYAPENKKISFLAEEVKVDLSPEQKKYLSFLIPLLSQKKWQAAALQQELYDLAKKNNFNPKKCFQAIYLSLSGKPYGPKAAWLLLKLERQFVIKRFKEAQK